eukprot:g30499.t1
MNLGVKLLTQASAKSESNAGDGTTSAAVLTQEPEMVNEGMQLVSSGYNPVLMQKGMKAASSFIAKEVEKLAKPVESGDLKDIATVSVGGDEKMGQMISKAVVFFSSKLS